MDTDMHGRDVTPPLPRRDFLLVAAAVAGGWALLPTAAAWRRPRASGAGSAAASTTGVRGGTAAGLPPRTVGLRSLGGDFAFDPPGLLIGPGDSIVWLNMGDFHTVTSFHPRHADLLPGEVPLRMPERAEPFHSGMLGLDAGTRFEHRFTIEGVYDYFCQPHYSFGMVGRVVVGAPRGGPATTRPLSELPEPARGELPAVETITGPEGRTFEWASRINGLLLLRAGGKEVAGPAGALQEGARGDETLHSVLTAHGEEEAFFRALGALVDGIESDAGYEELIRLGDEAKASLDRARAGA